MVRNTETRPKDKKRYQSNVLLRVLLQLHGNYGTDLMQ